MENEEKPVGPAATTRQATVSAAGETIAADAPLAEPASTPVANGEAPPVALSRRVRESLYNYAVVTGWAASCEARRPITIDGAPLPWYTYSAIHFISSRIKRGMRVFEYGTGNSTLWWASRVAAVTSCEHHPDWYAQMVPKVPANVTYLHRDLESGAYARAILEGSDVFDVVVIDGRDRVACAAATVQRLAPDGVIIWDNAERSRYRVAYRDLATRGFRRLPFRGHGPINKKEWETSIFYRSSNCLGL